MSAITSKMIQRAIQQFRSICLMPQTRDSVSLLKHKYPAREDVMVSRTNFRFVPMFLLLSGLFYLSYSLTIALNGTVKDASGSAISGAVVRLVTQGSSATTNASGAYNMNTTVGTIRPGLSGAHFAEARISGQFLSLSVPSAMAVRIVMCDLSGKMVADIVHTNLSAGEYRLPLTKANLASKIYVVKAQIGDRTSTMKFASSEKGSAFPSALTCVHSSYGKKGEAKTVASVDTLAASASGYIAVKKAIDSYAGTNDLVLAKAPFDIVYPADGSRIFKSPGGTIMFQWNPLAGATSYDVIVDGATVATGVPGIVPFSPVAVTKFTTVNGAHTWKVVATTSAGQQTSSTFTFTIATAVDGTTGAPFGGIGAGAVKFCPWQGSFAFQAMVPPGKQGYVAQGTMQFQLYTKRGTAVLTQTKLVANKLNNRYDDDAVYPVQYANFGTTNDVTVTMTAVSPFNRDDMKRTTYPLACYQFTLWNNQTTSVDASLAFETNTPQAPSVIAGKGFATSGGTERAIFAKSSDPSATVSVGNDAGFLTAGTLNNQATGTDNKVAVKVTLGPGEKKDVKFVFAWYKADDKKAYYYTNFVTSAQATAQYGLDSFDLYRDKAVAHVERFRASNVPDWMLNQTMNEIVWVNNVQYMADGRYGVTEGIYGWMGQMDQGWHAFGAGIWQVPEVLWSWKSGSEMEFWARTMMVGGTNDGQMSHDFTGGDHGYCQWDDAGYHGWGGPDWADQDCGFLFGVYEGFIATGDKTRMDYYWPYMKRTAHRLYYMATTQNATAAYPFTFTGSGATYDKGSQDHDLYNSGLALTAFKIMQVMAGVYNETALRDSFSNAYTTGVASFQKRYLNNNSFTKIQETTFAGLWMSLLFGLGQQFPDSAIDKTFNYMLTSYWNPLTLGMSASASDGESSGWVQYVVSHLGGALLMTNRVQEWRALERDLHNRIITNRNRVYNSSIYLCYQARTENYAATEISGSEFYCSIPVLWHNYMGFTGFLYNAYTGELWLQPRLANVADQWGEAMNHQLTDACICMPGTYGSLSYKETGTNYTDKALTVSFDKPVKVTAIYVTDNYPGAVNASVNGVAQQIERSGIGKADKVVKIKWTGTIGPSGIKISATN